MRYAVVLTAGAEQDLAAIHDYLLEIEGAAVAARMLKRLEHVSKRLATVPERGAWPRELAALGIREYRQILMKPWRIIYRVIEKEVVIMLIADSRRDMQSLLARRLLAP